MGSKNWFSGFGLAAIALSGLALLGVVNGIGSSLRIDLTENSLYTLSEGTENIVQSIDKPITMKLFFSYTLSADLPEVRGYGRRVESLLQEIQRLNEKNINLKVIDPEPFSEDEDAAAELGLQSVPVSNGTDIFFGVAMTNEAGEREVIPFLRPDKESFLEYELAQKLYRLGRDTIPTVGLMSSLDVRGGFDMMSRSPTPAWTVFSQLEQLFQVKDVALEAETIDEDIDLLLLLHPKGLSDKTLYALDQFVLRGGRLMAFVDPRSESDQPSMPMGGSEYDQASNLDTLLKQWGVEIPQKILLDDERAAQVNGGGRGGVRHLGVYSYGADYLDQDDVATSQINSINLATAGVILPLLESSAKLESSANVTLTPLLTSSSQVALTEPAEFQNLTDPRALSYGFVSENKPYVVAARLAGKAKSAFPGGVIQSEEEALDESGNTETGTPDTTEKGTSENEKSVTDSTSTEFVEDKPPHLESGDIQVLLVADTDLLADQLWVQVQNFFGRTVAQPFADNGTFVMNAVEHLLGSNDLIKIRSRARYSRPFEKVQDLQQQASEAFREREKTLNEQLEKTEQKLAELQQPPQDGVLTLGEEQQQALIAFQAERLKVRKELREVQRQLNSDIDRLGVHLKLINILLVPILIGFGALFYSMMRRTRI